MKPNGDATATKIDTLFIEWKRENVMLDVRIWGCQPRSFLLLFGVVMS